MVNYACGFNQSETGKCIEWIVTIFIKQFVNLIINSHLLSLCLQNTEIVIMYLPYLTYNPGQNSWDIKAITRKNDVFPPCPSPGAMLVSGIQVIFGKLNIAWGKGGKRNGLLKQHCQPFLRSGFRVKYKKCIFALNFHNCPMIFWPGL